MLRVVKALSLFSVLLASCAHSGRGCGNCGGKAEHLKAEWHEAKAKSHSKAAECLKATPGNKECLEPIRAKKAGKCHHKQGGPTT